MQKEIQLCEAEEKELKEKEQEFLLKNREIQDKLHLFLPQLEYSEKAKQRLESELKFNQDLLERKNQQIESFLKEIEDEQVKKEAAEKIKQKEEQRIIAKREWESQKEICDSFRRRISSTEKILKLPICKPNFSLVQNFLQRPTLAVALQKLQLFF